MGVVGTRPEGPPPSAIVKEKGGFRLRAGKTELAGIARNAPRGVVPRARRAGAAQSQFRRAIQSGTGRGRYASAKNILSQHARFLIEEDEATKIVGDMKGKVTASWNDTVRASGVSESDAEIIRGAFVYPGFSQ